MKLTKDTLIEGQIYKKGRELNIKEDFESVLTNIISSMASWKSDYLFTLTTEQVSELSSRYNVDTEDITALGDKIARDVWEFESIRTMVKTIEREKN